MGPNERRRKIIEIISLRRYETMSNLAAEFCVCRKTICRDIQALSLIYPLYTTRGTYGGVYILDGFYLERRMLTPVQQQGLENLLPKLSGNEKAIVQSVLDDFALKV